MKATGKKSNCIELLSSGEVDIGMYIIAYESSEMMIQGGNMFDPSPRMEFVVRNINPWFKGIPYQVVGKAGPIVAIKTHELQRCPPVVFLDTRLVKLMSVSKEFHDEYVAHMKTNPETVAQGPNLRLT